MYTWLTMNLLFFKKKLVLVTNVLSLIYVHIEKFDSKIICQCTQNKEKDVSHPTEINTQIKIYCYYVYISYNYKR